MFATLSVHEKLIFLRLETMLLTFTVINDYKARSIKRAHVLYRPFPTHAKYLSNSSDSSRIHMLKVKKK